MDNPSAFPNQPFGSDGLPEAQASPGMTLRDWFAGQALGWPDTGGLSPSEAAEYAYEYADAMLVQRAKAIAAAMGEV